MTNLKNYVCVKNPILKITKDEIKFLLGDYIVGRDPDYVSLRKRWNDLDIWIQTDQGILVLDEYAESYHLGASVDISQ